MYKKNIDDYIKFGHVKLLSKEESSKISNKANYIPKHGVVNVNKRGTLRVVFDASAKRDNIPLNDKLLQGIDYLNSLVGVLTKFRHGKYGKWKILRQCFYKLKLTHSFPHFHIGDTKSVCIRSL